MEPTEEGGWTPALEEARRRRAELRDAVYRVEQAISGPAAGRIPEWVKGVRHAVDGLRGSFEEHVLVTERPGGLYDEVRERAPWLATKLARLQQEHPEIQRAIREMLDRLDAHEPDGDWPLEEARDDLQRLLGKVVRHRQHGADLVWEAYNLDIGGMG